MTEIQQFSSDEGIDNKKKIISTTINEKKFLKYVKKQKKRILNYSFIIIIIIGLFFYKLSLQSGCNEPQATQANCLIKLSSTIFYLLGFYMIISIIIFEISLLFILKKYISYIHLIYMVPLYIYMVHFHDKGGDLIHHGAYNKIIFYFLIIVIGIILSFLSLLFTLIIKKYYKIFFSIITFFICIIGITRYKVSHGCTKWSNGLNDLKIENDPERDKCYFPSPKKCWINMLDGKFDASRIIGETCETFRKDEKRELYKHLSDDLQKSYSLAYPITTEYSYLNESSHAYFYYNIIKNMINMENEKNEFKDELKPEIFIKFDPITEKGKINIKINRKNKVAEERNKIYNNLPKDEIPRYKDFLFIYIDSLSRAHFVRKFKKTQKFLEQFYKPNKLYDFYQMIKYHSLLFFTLPNANPMFYGESMFNSNGTSILKAFKEKGFMTGQSNNICSRELYDFENDFVKNINFENFDHENIAMMCDPNFYKIENPFTAFLGPYSLKRRCLYGRDTFEYVLEYGEKFWETYKNEHKFIRLSFQEAHEGTGEVVTLLDVAMEKFLKKFQKKGYLDNTVIFFVSDHGNNMFGFYEMFKVEDFVMEKALPCWLILLPKSKNLKEISIIKENQQKFVTPYDIHDTILDIFNYKKGHKYYSRMGQTIFKPINAKERNCEAYLKDIEPVWCRCVNYK